MQVRCHLFFSRPPGNSASGEKHNTDVNWRAYSSTQLRSASVPDPLTPQTFMIERNERFVETDFTHQIIRLDLDDVAHELASMKSASRSVCASILKFPSIVCIFTSALTDTLRERFRTFACLPATVDSTSGILTVLRNRF